MTEPRPRPYPSIPAVIFTLWVLVVPLLFGDRMLNADGDMLRHVAHGRWMLEHGQFLHSDQFSYTKGGEPFVAFEYGSQLLYAMVERLAGLAGVVVLGSLLIAGSYAVMARFLLARGADPFSTYATTMVAAVIGAVHWAARPHLITLLFVAFLLFFLEPGERRPKLWVLFLMFMVWANLHGGFVFGLTLLGIYLVGSLGEWRWGADPVLWKERSRYYALALLVAGLGTLVNPNGLALHLHIIRFFGEPFLRDNTEEFLSPDFHSVPGQMLMATLLGDHRPVRAPSRPANASQALPAPGQRGLRAAGPPQRPALRRCGVSGPGAAFRRRRPAAAGPERHPRGLRARCPPGDDRHLRRDHRHGHGGDGAACRDGSAPGGSCPTSSIQGCSPWPP